MQTSVNHLKGKDMKGNNARQLYGAIFIGLIIVTLLYFNHENDSVLDFHDTTLEESVIKRRQSEKTSINDEKNELPSTDQTQTLDNLNEPEETTTSIEEQQKAMLASFKKTIELEVNLPETFNYSLSDIDGIAAISGLNKDGETLSLLATDKKLSAETVAELLGKNKEDFPFLSGHEFKINGEKINIPTTKDSGISKITLMYGGGGQDGHFYGAVCERADGRGTYLFVIKTDPGQLKNLERDVSPFLRSISTK